MGKADNEKEVNILRRLLRYAERYYRLSDAISAVGDSRMKPRITAGRVAGSILLMLWARIGSVNGLVQKRPAGHWRRWLGGELPSARSIGRIAAGMNIGDLRAILRHHYTRRRRNKSLHPFTGGIRPVIFDAHESTSSYLRCCEGCLRRRVTIGGKKHIQYYHRYVMALLLHRDGYLLFDIEPQKPGEGETTAALRLLKRLLERYPRAFNTVIGDNLYLNPSFCRLAAKHGKYFLAVLKNEKRDLLVDARALFECEPWVFFKSDKKEYQCWDIEGFTTWEKFEAPVRVVRSIETSTIRRQLTGENEELISEWIWVTNLPKAMVGSKEIIRIGHARWRIENNGFNEMVNEWNADHVYKHEPNAMLVFLLLLLLAYNLFHAFLSLNIKPQLRARFTARHFAKLIASEFYISAGDHYT